MFVHNYDVFICIKFFKPLGKLVGIFPALKPAFTLNLKTDFAHVGKFFFLIGNIKNSTETFEMYLNNPYD